MSNRAALYLRVSTLDQNPKTQLYDLHTLARQRHLEIVKEYTDHGFSGDRARRPALDELLRDARRGQFDVVVVWACDRLARSVSHFLQVLDELNHLNIEFVSFRENIDTGGLLGRAVSRKWRPVLFLKVWVVIHGTRSDNRYASPRPLIRALQFGFVSHSPGIGSNTANVCCRCTWRELQARLCGGQPNQCCDRIRGQITL